MKRLFILGAFAALSGCGADGSPERPEPAERTGVFVTGTAEIGVVSR